jgi:hypothetical protein
LQWTDNSAVETGFTLQRATDSAFGTNLTSFPIAANAAGGLTTYVDIGVVANTPYYYRVLAFNGAVASTWSNTASATISGQSAVVIIDNGTTGTSSTGTWAVSGAPNPYGANSLYGTTGSTYTWSFTPAVTGTYRISMWWTALSTRYTAVPVRVWNGGTIANLTVNQTLNGGMWNILGQWPLTAGTSYKVTITVTPSTSPPSTCADAVRFERM